MPIMSYMILQNAIIPRQVQLIFPIQSGEFREGHAFNVAASQKYVDTLSKIQAIVRIIICYVFPPKGKKKGLHIMKTFLMSDIPIYCTTNLLVTETLAGSLTTFIK